jgi:hypothetical protein
MCTLGIKIFEPRLHCRKSSMQFKSQDEFIIFKNAYDTHMKSVRVTLIIFPFMANCYVARNAPKRWKFFDPQKSWATIFPTITQTILYRTRWTQILHQSSIIKARRWVKWALKLDSSDPHVCFCLSAKATAGKLPPMLLQLVRTCHKTSIRSSFSFNCIELWTL